MSKRPVPFCCPNCKRRVGSQTDTTLWIGVEGVLLAMFEHNVTFRCAQCGFKLRWRVLKVETLPASA